MKHSLLLVSVLLSFVATASANTLPIQNHQWDFQVSLDEKPIGQHRFMLEKRGAEKRLTSAAEFSVNFLFFNVYRYVHQATENWSGDCLERIDSVTDDNGTRYSVDGTVQDGQLIVATEQGRTRLPSCVMSFAYWNPAILQQNRLLNSQTGDWVDVVVRSLGQEKFSIGTKAVTADRYELQAEGRRITLWYSSDDKQWLGLDAVLEGGYRLSYRLAGDQQAHSAQLPHSTNSSY